MHLCCLHTLLHGVQQLWFPRQQSDDHDGFAESIGILAGCVGCGRRPLLLVGQEDLDVVIGPRPVYWLAGLLTGILVHSARAKVSENGVGKFISIKACGA